MPVRAVEVLLLAVVLRGVIKMMVLMRGLEAGYAAVRLEPRRAAASAVIEEQRVVLTVVRVHGGRVWRR